MRKFNVVSEQLKKQKTKITIHFQSCLLKESQKQKDEEQMHRREAFWRSAAWKMIHSDENTQQLQTSVQASALPSSNMKRLINTGKLASFLGVDASHSGSLSPTSGFSSSLVQFGSSTLKPPQPPLANLLSYTLFSKTVRGRGFSLVARSYDAEWNE